ncbi:MAG: CPBP family intramembrane glutamic endopeptidase [Candidatus Micrarchaeota archaeon]
MSTIRGLLYSAFHGIGLFFVLILIPIGISFCASLLNIQPDITNIYQKVVNFPFYLIVFGVLFAPISEEIFFRAFLAGRYGIILSSFLFAISHIFYNSIFEIIGVFFIGIALSYYFVKKSNLIACIIAHLLYNLLSISVIYSIIPK